MLAARFCPCIIGQMTTVRDLLLEGKRRLTGVSTARLEAEILLSRAMGVSRAHLFAHPGQEVADAAFGEFVVHMKGVKAASPSPISPASESSGHYR